MAISDVSPLYSARLASIYSNQVSTLLRNSSAALTKFDNARSPASSTSTHLSSASSTQPSSQASQTASRSSQSASGSQNTAGAATGNDTSSTNAQARGPASYADTYSPTGVVSPSTARSASSSIHVTA